MSKNRNYFRGFIVQIRWRWRPIAAHLCSSMSDDEKKNVKCERDKKMSYTKNLKTERVGNVFDSMSRVWSSGKKNNNNDKL